MKKIYLEVRGYENNFVACACTLLEDISKEEAEQALKDKMIEYNWEEEQTELNALDILKDALIEIGKSVSTISCAKSYKGIIDSYSTSLCCTNNEKYSEDLEDGLITFSKDIGDLLKAGSNIIVEIGDATDGLY